MEMETKQKMIRPLNFEININKIIISCCTFSFSLTFFFFLMNTNAFSAESVVVQENIHKLKKDNSCRGCDLSGADLTRFELSGADLEGADLSGVKFFLANLAGANLKHANLRGAIFGGADLGEADLRGADLRGALLESAYLGGTLLDGQFVKARPYESVGVTEVEKDVYIEDQSKPKKNPVKREVSVAPRRDFEDPPPPIIADNSKKRVRSNVPEPKSTPIPHSPPAKTPNTFKNVVVKNDVTTPAPIVAKKEQVKKTDVQKKEIFTETVIKSDDVKEKSIPVVEVKPKPEKNEGIKKVTPVVTVANKSQDLAADKRKKDNLDRLLDKNKCYECDLSGLDLAGHDFEDADLEKADLTGCNLEKVDLEGANLKGAKLVGANLRKANLKNADLYKADLTGADLSGVNLKDAALDGTILESVIW